MESSEEVVKERKEKLKKWLKNPYNLILVAVLLFALVIRLHYFFMTSDQPLWWDEADYMAYAKNLAGFQVDWIVTPEHKSLLSFIVAAFFKLGASESLTKLFIQVIPSILTVLLAYLVCIEMYKDKRIGLIVAFLVATFWAHLFNSMRFHVGIPALFTAFLAIYVFWQGYENRKKIFGKIDTKWAIPITVFFVMLTYSIRRGYFLFGIFFFIYMLLTRNWKSLIKDKYNWVALALAIILLFLMENLIFASAEVGVGAFSTYFQSDFPINFLSLQVFSSYFSSLGAGLDVLLYLFWLGFALLTLNFLLSLGHIRRITQGTAKSDLFNILSIIITLFFFIYVIRAQNGFGEPRWFFPLLLGSLICISRASLKVIDYIKPYSKHLAIGLLIAMIGFGGYYEVKHADSIIKSRVDSFTGIREASLFINSISGENDIIISKGEPQVMYYSERKAIQPSRLLRWDGNDVPFEPFLEKIREIPEAKYLLVSFSEPNHPPWMKQVQYTSNGQYAIWEIPFMDTKIDFINNQQDIKPFKTYEDITFTLLDIKQDIFIYSITRN